MTWEPIGNIAAPSAYDVAVANGFVGTEEAWLASLKGDTGPAGPLTAHLAQIEALDPTTPGLLGSVAGVWDRLTAAAAKTFLALDLVPNVDARARATHTGVQAMATITGLATALGLKADLVDDGAGNMVVPTSQIPSMALNQPIRPVANRAAMLALTGIKVGQLVSITSGADKGLWSLGGTGDQTDFANWVATSVPTDVVQSVNGQQGIVVLAKGDVGLDQVQNTSDANKPVSTATQTALNAKVSTSGATFAGRLAIYTDTTGLVLQSGGANLSTDTTLVANSDAKVPTEKAVKTYVDGTGNAKAAKSTLTAKGSLYVATAASTPAELLVGADKTLLMADAAAGPGVKWATVNQIRAAIGLAPVVAPASGERFIPTGWQAQSTANMGNNSGRLAPFLVDAAFTLNELNAAVTTAGEAGSTFRFMLYGDTGNAYPGALLFEAGGLSTAAIGTVTTTLSLLLNPGLYWLGGVCQNAATTAPIMTACSVALPIALRVSAQSPTTGNIGYFQSVAGSAPANWTATVGNIGTVPRMTLKAA